MKRYVVIYGGTQLSGVEASFVEDLSYAILAHSPENVIVTGGYRRSSLHGGISTDVSALVGVTRFISEHAISLSDRFETWLPDPELDRIKERVERFHKGKVIELKGESPEARRFILAKNMDAIITIKGQKHTATVLDFALAINKPFLPLPFTGGDSLDYWKEYKTRIQGCFQIDDGFAGELESVSLDTMTDAAKAGLIQKIVTAMTTGLGEELNNRAKYEARLRQWNTENDDELAGNKETTRSIDAAAKDPESVRQFKVFLSYSHKDEDLKSELDKHLTALKRDQSVAVWNDRKLAGGDNWDDKIRAQLSTADVILLLVSPDFMVSEYIWRVELASAFERQRQRKARVVPIFLRKVDFTGTPFERLQGYPRNARPVMSFQNQDEAFYEVVAGIRADLKNW